MLGTGIASAIGPYLGLTLKGLDPRLPFALAGLSLAAITAGMVWAERALSQRRAADRAAGMETAAAPPASHGRRDGVVPIPGFLLAALLAAAAAQVHAKVVAAPLYLRHAPASMLPVLLPVFWAGFNLALMPASLAVRRFGALPMMAGGVLVAGACSAGAWNATSLEALLPLQGLAGAAWGRQHDERVFGRRVLRSCRPRGLHGRRTQLGPGGGGVFAHRRGHLRRAGAGGGHAMGLGPASAFRLECGTVVGHLVAQPQRLILSRRPVMSHRIALQPTFVPRAWLDVCGPAPRPRRTAGFPQASAGRGQLARRAARSSRRPRWASFSDSSAARK
ncbi:MAG: hypothetical protein IPP87_16595 [Ideonella sp.]|nr:hypothetical protein [Ideonella sp.]